MKTFAALPRGASVLMSGMWALAGGTTFVLIEHALGAKAVKEPLPWLVVAAVVSLTLICYLVHRILLSIEELYLRSRFSIRYMPFPEGDVKAIRAVYATARRLVKRADPKRNCHIMAVNAFGEKFDDPTNRKAETAHHTYFAELEKLFGKVNYHRIVQYDPGPRQRDLNSYLSRSYRRHFQRTIAYRRSHQSVGRQARLDCVELRYPTTYVVLQNGDSEAYLFWQLNELVRRDGEAEPVFRPRGFLFITDPEQQLVSHFKEWFTALTNSDSCRPIRTEEVTGLTSGHSRLLQFTWLVARLRKWSRPIVELRRWRSRRRPSSA